MRLGLLQSKLSHELVNGTANCQQLLLHKSVDFIYFNLFYEKPPRRVANEVTE